MQKSKKLNKRQLAVLEDLFTGDLDEQAVLDKHAVSRQLYEQWFAQEQFAEQFERRMDRAYRQSRMILARYAPVAAAKLVELTNSDKAETARKACLDIISPPRPMHSVPSSATPSNPQAPAPDLPPEIASRLLAALAQPTSA
jgi:hypothetical protein